MSFKKIQWVDNLDASPQLTTGFINDRILFWITPLTHKNKFLLQPVTFLTSKNGNALELSFDEIEDAKKEASKILDNFLLDFIE